MSGLEGVIAAETRLSLVEGEKGRLLIGGLPVEEFSKLSFEQAGLNLLDQTLSPEARCEAYQHLEALLPMLGARPPVEALRLGLSALPSKAPASLIVGAFPVLLAGWRHGTQMLAPDPQLGQVEDLLRMWEGKPAPPERVRALSRYLVTVSDHGMNASTFVGRIVASTRADRLDTVISALGALKGPLHGGAPGPVLDLLDELNGVSDLPARLQQKLVSGERLMGFGHRVYRTSDPRAAVLREALAGLGHTPRLEHARRVEDAALKALAQHKPERALRTNVEFYTAVLLEQLGFERDLFTALFATGRVLGWLAHYQEQEAVGKLIRPRARYIGPDRFSTPNQAKRNASNQGTTRSNTPPLVKLKE